MKISINAPSWHRPNGVKTLKYLPYCKIWVDESEYDEYVAMNPGANIISCKKGIQGNISRIRNHIIKMELAMGMDAVVLIDDDLKGIYRFEWKNGFLYNKVLLTAEDFPAFVEKYSVMAQDLGAKLWGLNCIPDAMAYRETTPFSTNRFVGAPFGCFLKGNKCWYDERLPLKEDYDMTLQQLNMERVVLRINYYHYVAEQSTQAGGCATYRNREREKEQFFLLQKKWGGAIIRQDVSNKGDKAKVYEDYNPILKSPIKGV